MGKTRHPDAVASEALDVETRALEERISGNVVMLLEGE